MLTPDTEAALAALVAVADAPFVIEGQGTKRAMLRPVQAAATLSTRNLTGITLHRPTELIISARAGTLVADVEAALAAKGQMLIAEPPAYGGIFGAGQPTIGGTVAAGISGPRRITGGAMRDHVMGVRFINGMGEVLRSGGRVLKNITGLDLCKLLTGSHGTLGIITEVTLKVLPRPEATATLAVTVTDFAAGQWVLSAGLGAPYGVSGAAVVGNRALLRLEDFADSVAYRIAKLRGELAAFGSSEIIEGDASLALWRDVAEAKPLGAAAEDAIWRVSVKPTQGPHVAAALRTAFDAKVMLDWGGGLVWVAGPANEAAHRAVMQAAGEGAFVLFRAPDALRAAVPVIKADPPALAAIARRVKDALDPKGLFNPGRMQAGF